MPSSSQQSAEHSKTRQGRPASSGDVEQLFVIGAPRSGTTFLASMLSHSRFGEPIETHFITKVAKRTRAPLDRLSRRDILDALRKISKERAVMQWRIDLDEEAVIGRMGPVAAYSDLVNAVMLSRPERVGARAWADKTPHFLADLPLLASLFPQAKFVHIVRDGRDVALSLLRKEWGPNNLFACARYWRDLNDQPETFERLEREGRYLLVQYENILSRPLDEMRRIYRFIGERFPEAQLAEDATSTLTTNKDKWRAVLTPPQRRMFDGIAAAVLRRYGYEVAADAMPPGPTASALYAADDRIRRAVFLAKTNLVDGFRIRFLGAEPFAD